jgi:hypothetical protein
MDDDIKSTILRTSDANAIKKVGVERGMITLRRDGARKVLEGITTIEEMLPAFQDIAKEKPLQEKSCRGFSVKVNSNFVKLKLELHAKCMGHKEDIFCATVYSSQFITIVLEEVTG